MKSVHIDDLPDLEGSDLGVSDWHVVTQEEIDRFAEATHDRQWIHVDPERARRESPFGGTIAHGYYSIALAPFLFGQILEVTGIRLAINRGLRALEFIRPVRIGRKVRLGVRFARVEPVRHGAEVTAAMTLEVEGERRPGWKAEAIYRYWREA